MHRHSLKLLEYDRVTGAVAARAESVRGRRALEAWTPIADRRALAEEHDRLAEAIARTREPGTWCAVGEDELAPRLDPEHGERLDGPGLVALRGWLDAAAATREAWDEAIRARFPSLARAVEALPALEELRSAIAAALDPDGRVRDQASPALGRARAAVASGEREIQERLSRWSRPYGEGSYVTRHADRFVVLVPAAGFSRRRGIVHDVSGSGQSLFVEPLEACEANNRILEARATAAEEERRILRELSDAARAEAPALERVEGGLAALDALRARARWALEFGGIALRPGGDRLRLRAARHPLLAMGDRRRELVPLDLELAAPGRLLLVSGPNMGGKTVLLKTVGLSVVLAHAAFPVPAGEGSAVPEIDVVVVDLGDEQSVDQGLSTFAAHLRVLARMAERAGPRSLLLCDELGAGTDPEEGAALGRALVEHFAARGAWGVLTTHLGSLKRVAGEVPGVVNGSLEFDEATLTPRYQFVAGLPGASHALSVAGRLGFPEALLARARALAPAEAVALERLLGEVQAVRRELEEEARGLAAARGEAERAAADHRAAAEGARRDLAEVRRRLTRESQALLANARELWQSVRSEARRAEKSKASADRLAARIGDVERDLSGLERTGEEASRAFGAAAAPPAPPLERVAVGQRVRVRDLGVDAEVVSAADDEGRVMLRRGSWSIQSHVSRLEAARSSAPEGGATPGARWETAEGSAAVEVDLRGMDVEEALRALDHGLDRALVQGFGSLRIIHGVGRGVLRAAVERHLRGHPQVSGHRLGGLGEGGRGVTVATLR